MSDKGKKGEFFWSVILAVLAFLLVCFDYDEGSLQIKGNFGYALLFAWVFAGIPWGWKGASFIPIAKLKTGATEAIQSAIMFTLTISLRLMLSCLIGLVTFPLGIIEVIFTHKNEKNRQNQQNVNNSGPP